MTTRTSGWGSPWPAPGTTPPRLSTSRWPPPCAPTPPTTPMPCARCGPRCAPGRPPRRPLRRAPNDRGPGPARQRGTARQRLRRCPARLGRRGLPGWRRHPWRGRGTAQGRRGGHAAGVRDQQRLPHPGRHRRAADELRRAGRAARRRDLRPGCRAAAGRTSPGRRAGPGHRRQRPADGGAGTRPAPGQRGRQPGNGSLIQVIATATGVQPLVAGKPEPPLHRESVLRTGAGHPLVVGDRLDTDIEGAHRVGADSMLVLTGVTSPAEAVLAPPSQRPTYLAEDLTGLLEPHPDVTQKDGAFGCVGWTAHLAGDRLELAGEGERIDGLRALCAAAWATASAAGAGAVRHAAERLDRAHWALSTGLKHWP